MNNIKTSCRKRFESKTGCCGNCLLNVTGLYTVWEVMSTKCNGDLEDKNMLNGVFYNKIDKTVLYNKYKLTEGEKTILDDGWR